MALGPDKFDNFTNAARDLARHFKMNSENAAREAAARAKQQEISNEIQNEAMRRTHEFYEATAEGQAAMDQDRIAQKHQQRQEAARKAINVMRSFLSDGGQTATAVANSAPGILSGGAAAATHLARMGGTGMMGAGGFALGGAVVSVAAVVALCGIVVFFAIALNELAKDNAKRRAELEAARTKALLNWEKKFKVPPQRQHGAFMPKNL